LQHIAVITLAHFMMLVCLGKWLQHRTLRDDAQVFILCSLLTVVVAIVSDDAMFPVLLLVYLTIGLDVLIRLHLELEQAHIRRLNEKAQPIPVTTVSPWNPRFSSWKLTLATATSALLLGTTIFVVCPRIDPGSFGRLSVRQGGHLLTGLTAGHGIETIGPIRESNQPVMRVQIQRDGESLGPAVAAGDIPLYFRAFVSEKYVGQRGRFGFTWQWQQNNDKHYVHSIEYLARDINQLSETLPLFPPEKLMGLDQSLIQKYWLQPTTDSYLLSLYPPLQIKSNDVVHVIRQTDREVLLAPNVPSKVTRYTIASPAKMSDAIVTLLASERIDGTQPDATPPFPPLPREAEIRQLIRTEIGNTDARDNPKRRFEFARRIEQFLRSPPFTYTLDPVAVPRSIEPISDFLLKSRRGHCEWFASAMAIMCQMSGIPARVVTGYQGGEYNPVGDFLVVRQKNAHAWVEVFIPSQEWVRFDPTPLATARAQPTGNKWLLGLRRHLDYIQFQWSNYVVAYDMNAQNQLLAQFKVWLARPVQDETTVPGAVAAFVRELFGGKLKLSAMDRLLYWVFAILVLALILLNGYVVTVVASWLIVQLKRLRWRRAFTPFKISTEFYHRFCRRLEALNLQRHPSQTPAEFADQLAERSALFSEAPYLVSMYYAVAFGRQTLTPQQRARIESFLQRLRDTRNGAA